MTHSFFLEHQIPPRSFTPEDFRLFKETIRSILDSHRTFIKEYFNRKNLVSLTGYSLEKVANGNYEDLSNLEAWLLIRGLRSLGCLDEEYPANFAKAIDSGPSIFSILWLADIEPNLIRCLQLYNRFARARGEINGHIYNFKDNLLYYGYFCGGEIFYLHEVDLINQAYRKTTQSDLVISIPKLKKYLKRAGCKELRFGGNIQKIARSETSVI